MSFKYLIILCILFFQFNVYSKTKRKTKYSVMSYNVQNLFDTIHDTGKNDWEYLPINKLKIKKCHLIKNYRYRKKCLKSNWTDQKLKNKLTQIRKIIKFAKYPTFIALQEVENKRVLNLLLKSLPQYKFFITQSDDLRGIDVALLYKSNSNFKLKSCRSIEPDQEIFKRKKTRNILHCAFYNKKIKLHFFVNHWPSLGNKNLYRMAMAKLLKENIKKLPSKDYIIALGDFNTIETLHPHPFWNELIVDSHLFNLHKYFMKSNKIKARQKYSMPLGTYFYSKKMQWNVLDHIFLSKNFKKKKHKNKIKLIIDSYQILTSSFFQDDFLYYRRNYLRGSVVRNIPKKYNFQTKQLAYCGFSDHFPVIFSFKTH